MEDSAEIVARGVRVFVCAAIAGAALALAGGVSFAVSNSQAFAASVPGVAKRAAPPADCAAAIALRMASRAFSLPSGTAPKSFTQNK